MTERIITLSVTEWLQKHPAMLVSVSPDTDILDIVRAMLAHESRDAYVIENGRVRGHLSFNKLVNHLFSHDRPVHSHRQLFARVSAATAEELMDPHFAYCREDEQINQILHRQLQCDVSDLVVLATDNTPIGVIKLTEVVRESLQ
ncbi:CBS domain-containing protein [Methylophaga sp.]|uniref:CBS domain-containing protein n=1 Tax=Methylophaga sp. TaxID=2024840 RepID=UPI0013FEFB45|nr:CBS domain-containing protein [Methylophaga sp.]MTI62477.1 CBS domain-containing protein [Methylophaga sp.]